MKKLIVIFLLISTNVKAQKDDSATEKYVVQLHLRKFEWLINKQMDSLKNLLDDRVKYIHSNGWTESKDEIIADLQTGKLNYAKVNVTESTCRVYKGAAIVNGKGVFNVVMDGKPLEIQLYYTEVYVKKKKGWQLVSRHANRL